MGGKEYYGRSETAIKSEAASDDIDDILTIHQSAGFTARLMKRFDEVMGWAQMRIKPSESLSLPFMKDIFVTSIA